MPRFVTVDEYLEYAPETLDWLVHGLIPRPSKILMVGPEKGGKSLLSIDISNRIASGEDFLGHKVEKGRVLYLQIDTPRPVWKGMLGKLKEGGTAFHPGFVLIHPEDTKRPLNLLVPDSRAYLKDCIHTVKPDLVVLDCLREIHTADENSSTEMAQVGQYLDELFGDVALLIVHHTKKNLFTKAGDAIVNPIHASRGGYMQGKVDGVWFLSVSLTGQLKEGTLYTVSRFDEEHAYQLVRGENILWEFPQAEKENKLTEAVLELCERFPEMTHNRLVPIAKAELGLSRSKFYRLLDGRKCVHSRKP